MTEQNFTVAFTVDQTPEEAFAAINDVRGWWSGEIEGSTDKLGEEFTYRYKDVHYSKQRITELIPGKRVVWLILDSYLNFTKDAAEWNGTEVVFDISKRAITPRSVSRIGVWFPHLSASMAAPTRGAFTSTAVCGA